MPWIISNGKSYVEITGNNQMITTAYIDRAHTFNNKKTAEKYCSLLPKAMKNLKYKVISAVQDCPCIRQEALGNIQ